MSIGSPSELTKITLKDLALGGLARDEGAFAAAFPGPALLVPLPEDPDEERRAAGIGSTKALRAMDTAFDHGVVLPQPQALETYYGAFVFRLQKPDDESPSVSRIGRRSKNEVVVPISTVSGRHGEFRVEPSGRSTYADLGSKNGSLVRGKAAIADVPVELVNGAEVVLSSAIRVMFLTTAGLWNLARVVRDQLEPS